MIKPRFWSIYTLFFSKYDIHDVFNILDKIIIRSYTLGIFFKYYHIVSKALNQTL